jgi:kynureninase
VPGLHAATAGYDIVEEIGVERIRENSMRQTAYFIELLDEAGFDVVSPREPERRGGSVVVRVPDYLAVHAELEARQILLDVRPDVGLRFGPHFFTTDEELESAAAALVEIAGHGARLSA